MAWTAMGFRVLSRVFVAAVPAPPFLAAANARGLRRLVVVRLQIGWRRMRLPFGVSEGAGD